MTESRAHETAGHKTAGVALALFVACALSAAFLFEGLFLDRSLLGLDNRLIPPFCLFKDESERVAVNLATSDINGFILPETFAQRRALARGAAPLWNPWQNLGQPLLADMGYAPFYPTALLALWFEPLREYAWSMALHLVWLALGVFLLLRRRSLGVSAAVFGGVVVAFSGFVSVHLHLPHFVRVFAWFPWWLLAMHRLAVQPSPRSTAWAAMVVAVMLLAAFPQVALWGIAAGGAYFVLVLAEQKQRRTVRSLAACALALLLGGAVSAIHLAPTQEALGTSLRPPQLDEQSALRASLLPPALWGAVAPRSLSWPVQEIRELEDARRLQDFPPHAHWLSADDQDNAVENTFWIGLLPLCLAIAALCRRPTAFTGLMACGAFLSLALALGMPGIADVVRALPGLGVGAPKRVLILTTFALGLLAAVGFERVVRERWRGPLVCAAVLGFTLFALSLLPFESRWFPNSSAEQLALFADVLARDRFGWLAAAIAASVAAVSLRCCPRVAGAVLVIASGADLVVFGRDFNPTQSLHDQYQATPAIDWLLQEPEQDRYRVLAFQGDFLLGGNSGQVFGFSMVNGVSALLDRRVGELLKALDPAMVDPLNPRFTRGLNRELSLRSPLLDLFGVRDLVVSAAGNTFLEQYGRELGVERVYASEAEKIAFWRRPTALPRAFFVPQHRVKGNAAERLAYLSSAEFDPHHEAVLEETPNGLGELGHAAAPPAVLSVHRARPERIEISLAGGAPALLVLSEAASTGWQATAQVGEEIAALAILRANHAFQAVVVPAGAREVVFEYRSAGFQKGRIAAAVGGLAIVLLLCWRAKTRTRNSLEEPTLTL